MANESRRERALRLATLCGVLKRTPNGSMPAARFSIDEVERLISLARAELLDEIINLIRSQPPGWNAEDVLTAIRAKVKEERDVD